MTSSIFLRILKNAAGYVLPKATADTLGGIKIGSGLSIDASGVVTAAGGSGGTPYTLPPATANTLGGVKIGPNITVDSEGKIGVAPPTSPYTLPAATSSALGGVKQGSNVSIAADGTISVAAPTPAYTLPKASSESLGGVRIGANVSIDTDGKINVAAPYTLPVASASTLGGVKAGANVTIATDGTLSVAAPSGGSYTLPTASSTVLGGVKVGSGLAIDGSGVLSASGGGGGMTWSNSAMTQMAVQDMITNAGDNTWIRLAPGTYNMASALSIAGKYGLTLDGGGQVTFTGPIPTFLVYSGNIRQLRITGIKFISTSSDLTERDGMITTDQSVYGVGYELDHCTFTGPNGNFNGHSWVPVDGRANQATNNNIFFGIKIHHNTYDGLGRCGIELLNQNLDRCRVFGLDISYNLIRNTGLHNEYGMGVSLSGWMEGTNIHKNDIFEATKYGIEAINVKHITISNNHVTSSVAGCAGISVNAQADNNGINLLNESVNVVGNTVKVRYSPIQMSDVRNATITSNTLYNVNSSDISNGAVRLVRVDRFTFTSNTVESSSYNALTLDNSKNGTVTSNTFSNENMNQGGTSYQVVWLYGSGTTKNKVLNNNYFKNTAQSDAQGNVFEGDGANNNTYTQ